MVCFVLETVRTSAMRVIHISVKTEETQILRIKFVLVLSYLNSNTTSVNRSMILVTEQIYHSICQQVYNSVNKQKSAIPTVNK